jgi:Uma2 family endonuclease
MQITSVSQLDPKGHYTYADYMTWRFEQMVELIRGRLFITSPSPASRHQRISSNLMGRIQPHFSSGHCQVFHAPFDVRLVKSGREDSDIVTVVQPDICVICDESKIDERGCLGSPDWIIEILSPATAKKDFNEKLNLYQENGVREYWIVNPDANVVHQFIPAENGEYIQNGIFSRSQTVQPHIFPELNIELERVFA